MDSIVDPAPAKVGPLDSESSSLDGMLMTRKISTWEESVDNVVSLYREIERRSLSLPTFSLYPALLTGWSVLKFEFCLFLDLFLLIPINIVVLLRNLFPGRWAYRSFSWRYIKNVLLWIWRGEGPVTPFAVIGVLVTPLIFGHFRSRLLLLRRRIMVESMLSSAERSSLRSKIDESLEQWPSRSFLSTTYTYLLPLSGPVIGIYNLIKPASPLPPWTAQLALGILSYSLAFVASAFLVKRGLFLGGSDRSSYYPGYLAGGGSYADERRIFETHGLATREFPIDIVISLVSIGLGIPLGLFILRSEFSFFQQIGIYVGEPDLSLGYRTFLVTILLEGAAFILLGWLAWFRRVRLGRS